MSTPFRVNTISVADKKGRGGFKGNWRERMDLPKEGATPFILVKGSYVDPCPDPHDVASLAPGQPVTKEYFKYRKHTREVIRRGKSGTYKSWPSEVCSAGWDPHNPQPCAGCMLEQTGDKSSRLGNKFAFTIIHLAPYHTHPAINKDDGSFLTRKDGQGYVLDFTECTQRANCNFCRTLRGEQPVLRQGDPPWPLFPQNSIGLLFGKRRYLELGSNHFEDFGIWDDMIRKRCACGSYLQFKGYTCPHCQSLIIDRDTDVRDDKELREITLRPHPCMKCQRMVILNEAVVCTSCEAAKRPTQQLDLFSCVLHGGKSGETTNTHLTLFKCETLEEFSKTVHPNYLGGKTLYQIVEELAQPYDFAEGVLKPRSIEEQQKNLGIVNEAAPQYGGYQTPYGQFQQMGAPQMAMGPSMPYPANPQAAYTPYAQYPQAQQPATGNGGLPTNWQATPGPVPFQQVAKPNFSK